MNEGFGQDRLPGVVRHPLAFIWRVLKSSWPTRACCWPVRWPITPCFSIVPLLILSVFALSHLVSQAESVRRRRYLEWLVPSQSQAVLTDVDAFLRNGLGIGVPLVGSLCSSVRWPFPCWRRRCASSSPIVADEIAAFLVSAVALLLRFRARHHLAGGDLRVGTGGKRWRRKASACSGRAMAPGSVSIGLFYGLGVVIETLVLAGCTWSSRLAAPA